MRETLLQIWAAIDWDRKILVYLGGVLLLSLSGPFGTYDVMSFSERLVFWNVVFLGVGVFMHVFQTTALNAPYLARLPRLLRLVPGAVLAGLPGAAVVIFVLGVFRPPVDAENLLAIWAQVSLVGWLVGAVEFGRWRRPSAAAAPANARSIFHRRLPPELGDEIISISMQDHYAEVTTTLGAQLVLIRLTDAISELNGAAGLQVHRSHYAMKAHLVRLQREGGRLKVILSDGRALPVSARHAEEVRAALQEARSEA